MDLWYRSQETKEAHEIIINEGKYLDALFFLLEGIVGIYIPSLGKNQLIVLGPGEILGEMSFLDNHPASASVMALEASHILVLPHSKLVEKLKEDTGFAARLYKSLATIIAKRFREKTDSFGRMIQTQVDDEIKISSVWQEVSNAMEDFKKLMQSVDKVATENNGIIPEEMAQQIGVKFKEFCYFLDSKIGDAAPANEAVKQSLGTLIRRELLPYLLLTKVVERVHSKPRGYAGDYLTIEWIYQNQPGGSGPLGPLLDRLFLDLPAAKAVRNRRPLLVKKIIDIIDQKNSTTAQVTSLACGPAREIFDVFEQIKEPNRLSATLVDMDFEALAFINNKIEKKKLQKHIHLIHGNLVYLAGGIEKMNVTDQDLVYSIGLIDYFEDTVVIKLLNYIHTLLKTGGTVILGNFHPRNPMKALWDRILDWKLIYRTEEDMDRLFLASAFKKECSGIQFENEGINMFAECIK